MEINKSYLIKNTILKDVSSDTFLEICVLNKTKNSDIYKILISTGSKTGEVNNEVRWVIKSNLDIIGEIEKSP